MSHMMVVDMFVVFMKHVNWEFMWAMETLEEVMNAMKFGSSIFHSHFTNLLAILANIWRKLVMHYENSMQNLFWACSVREKLVAISKSL